MISFSTTAQNEYLATLDYNDLTVSRKANIPGVTWIMVDNPAFDENGQRFFFMANATGMPPFNLYTINAVSGATIYSPVCPSNFPSGHIGGLQYDNAVDTLYAIYSNGNGSAWFSWIDQATGEAHIIKSIPAYAPYIASTFDKNNRWYICILEFELVVIEAATGNILYRNTFPPAVNVLNMVFNNANSRLYAVCNSNAWPNPQFDSISVTTGALHFIADLPKLKVPQLNTYCLDEAAGKYIFVADSAADSSPCHTENLFVLDVPSGNIVKMITYPYAEGTGNRDLENIIEFGFDNRRGILYALNWHVPGSPLPLTVSITASPNPACEGSEVVFNAIRGSGFSYPVYQWEVNGNTVGTDNITYTSSTLVTGDIIKCSVFNNPVCASPDTARSNEIVMQVIPIPNSSLTISASSTSICFVNQFTFTAVPVNPGPSPVYQWKLNGNNVGTNSAIFTINSLKSGDVIDCILTPDLVCSSPIVSNKITMTEDPPTGPLVPVVVVSASAIAICDGEPVTFTATPANINNAPTWQWQVNGNDVGNNSNSYTTTSLSDGDIVRCIANRNITCVTPVLSNEVAMEVNPVPTVFAGNDTIIAPGEIVPLLPVVSGTIAEYEWTPATALSDPSVKNPVAAPNISSTYQLKVITDKGCEASDKITITVYRALQMPNAFTPGTDRRNDVFRIPSSSSQRIKNFSVFNRWGEKVFNTTDVSQGWDGTYRNKPQPAGAYAWQIEYEDLLTGKMILAKGSVILIR